MWRDDQIHAGRLKDSRWWMKSGVFTWTTPTMHGEYSRGSLAACVTRVLSRVRRLQLIDDELHAGAFLLQVILAAGWQNFIPKSPNHTGSRLGGLTAKTSTLPGLPVKLLQWSFEKHRLGCTRGSEENTNAGLFYWLSFVSCCFLTKGWKLFHCSIVVSLTKKKTKKVTFILNTTDFLSFRQALTFWNYVSTTSQHVTDPYIVRQYRSKSPWHLVRFNHLYSAFFAQLSVIQL